MTNQAVSTRPEERAKQQKDEERTRLWQLVDLVKSQEVQNQVQHALPPGIQISRFTRCMVTEVLKNPRLADCSAQSLKGALIKSAQLGLLPGVLGQAWILPYWNNSDRQYEAQFIIGYQGALELARRSKEFDTFDVDVVRANDKFSVAKGTEPKLIHEPAIEGDRGGIVGYYAVGFMANGRTPFHFMSQKEIEDHRDKVAPRNKKGDIVGPWKTDAVPMGKKTVLIQLLKYQPKTPEILEAVSLSEREGVGQDLGAEAAMVFGGANPIDELNAALERKAAQEAGLNGSAGEDSQAEQVEAGEGAEESAVSATQAAVDEPKPEPRKHRGDAKKVKGEIVAYVCLCGAQFEGDDPGSMLETHLAERELDGEEVIRGK